MASPLDTMLAPDPAAQAAAFERLLRDRRALGMLGQLSGDKVIAPMGRQIMAGVDNEQQARAQAAQQLQAGRQQEAQRLLMAQQFQQKMGQEGDQFRQKMALEREALGLQRQKMLEPKPVAPPNPDELRKEFQGQQGPKDFRQVQAAYKKIQSTSDTGAGDMSLIFGYMKLLDPNSTVREGEYATAASAGNVGDKLVSIYNKAISGEKLSDDVRRQFRDEATKVYEAQKAQYNEVAKPYVDLAKKRGLDPAEVVFGYEDPGAAPPAAASSSPATADLRKKYGL